MARLNDAHTRDSAQGGGMKQRIDRAWLILFTIIGLVGTFVLAVTK
jgi:hypothetical protein